VEKQPNNFLTALLDKPCFETLIALKEGASTIAQVRSRLRGEIDANVIGQRLTKLERVGLVARFRPGSADAWFLNREGLSRAITCLSELLSGIPPNTDAHEFRVRVAKAFGGYKIYPTPNRLRILEALAVSSESAEQLVEHLTPKTTRRSVDEALWAFERAGVVSSKKVGPPRGRRGAITVVFSLTPLGLEMVRAIHGDNWPMPHGKKVGTSGRADQCLDRP